MHDQPAGQMVRCSKARAMFASRACRKSIMIGTPLNRRQMMSVSPERDSYFRELHRVKRAALNVSFFRLYNTWGRWISPGIAPTDGPPCATSRILWVLGGIVGVEASIGPLLAVQWSLLRGKDARGGWALRIGRGTYISLLYIALSWFELRRGPSLCSFSSLKAIGLHGVQTQMSRHLNMHDMFGKVSCHGIEQYIFLHRSVYRLSSEALAAISTTHVCSSLSLSLSHIHTSLCSPNHLIPDLFANERSSSLHRSPRLDPPYTRTA